MRPSQARFLGLAVWFLIGAFCADGSAQTGKPAAKLTPAEKAYREAMALQLGDKIVQARDKMKAAVRLAPKSAEYRDYLTELDALVEQDVIDKHAIQTPADAEVDILAVESDFNFGKMRRKGRQPLNDDVENHNGKENRRQGNSANPIEFEPGLRTIAGPNYRFCAVGRQTVHVRRIENEVSHIALDSV